MVSHRAERVADEIRAVLSEIIRRRMHDPRVSLATVAAVRLSPDLRHARVDVGWLGGIEGRDEAVTSLNRAAGFLRREIGRALRLKYVPDLVFRPDLQEDRAARIDETLRRIRGDDDAPEEGEEPR